MLFCCKICVITIDAVLSLFVHFCVETNLALSLEKNDKHHVYGESWWMKVDEIVDREIVSDLRTGH